MRAHDAHGPPAAAGVSLLPGERLDALGRDGLRIIQAPRRYLPFTSDVYLLAAFAAPHPGDFVLELGSGSGAVLLLLAARTRAAGLVGLEIQADLAALAQRNIELNGLGAKAEVLAHDLRVDLQLRPARFDLIVANPPYLPVGTGSRSRSAATDLAKQELACTLRDAIQAAVRWRKERGRLVLIHRAARLPEILGGLTEARFEPKRLALGHPRPGERANVVLIEGRTGAKPGLTVDAPLFVRGADGEFTPEMEEVFGGRWPWRK